MAHDDTSSRTNFSKFTKSVLFGQLLIIVALSIWLYREYLNNQYLQTYLAEILQRQGFQIAMLGLGAISGIGFVGVLLKARNIMGEIELPSSRIEDQTDDPPSFKPPSPMPVLQTVDNHPIDDVSLIHSSMRRWNERAKPRELSG